MKAASLLRDIKSTIGSTGLERITIDLAALRLERDVNINSGT